MAKKKINITNNYLKLALILVGVVFFTLLIANIYNNVSKSKINNGYLTKYISSINYGEIANTKLEFSGDTFLYISYTGDRDIYNLDVKLKKIIKDNSLNDKVIYLDMKERLDTKDYLSKLNETLGLNDKKIGKLPAILYYKDDILMTIADSKEGLLRSGDFAQLLEKYEIILPNKSND